MQQHRIALAMLAAMAVLPAQVRQAEAADTVFDFVAPRADQQGAYVTDANAVISGGLGTLVAVVGWFNEDWAYRLGLTINNPGTAVLADWQVPLVVDASTAAGYDLFNLAGPTGNDLRIVEGGAAISLVSFGHWDDSANRGRLWIRKSSIAVGDTNLELYFANPLQPRIDVPLQVFSYAAPYGSRFALAPSSTGVVMNVASAAAANDYVAGSSTGILNAGELAAVADTDWVSGETISAKAPFDVALLVEGASEGAPISFARTLHSVVANRGTNNTFTMIAPFADSTVTVSVGGTMVTTLNLTANTVTSYVNDLAADAVIQFDATTPIVVAHSSENLNDGYVLPPPASEVWGIRSGTPRVLAVDVDTTVTAYSSGGGTQTINITAGSVGLLTADTAGGGTGPALRLVATNTATGAPARITVLANGDGDGGDAIVFHPESELGRHWVVPSDGRFALISMVKASATCTLTPPGGGAPTIVTSSSSEVPPFPSRIKFGANTGTNITAGSVISCDTHGFAMYEHVNDDERNLYPMESHRKYAAQNPTAALSSTLGTRYNAGVTATIDTPDLVVPTEIAAWTDFRVAVSEPPNTEIRYQISVDQGTTYMVFQGSSWMPTPDPTFGATAIQVRDNLGTLPTASGTLRVRVLLKSNDGVTKPSVDSVRVFYEGTTGTERLVWDDLPNTVNFGEAFTAGITAVGVDGAQLTGVTGTVRLTASHGGAVLPGTVTITNGRLSESIKVLGVADDVTIRADGPDGLVGFSGAFDLVAAGGARLEIVGGDGQFGAVGALLGAPLVVRILDASDTPIPGVQITFAVTEGGGNFDPSGGNAAKVSDVNGEARVHYYLGTSAGANRIRASAAALNVEFVARADIDATTGEPEVEDGCRCDTGHGAPPLGGVLLFIGLVFALRPKRSV